MARADRDRQFSQALRRAAGAVLPGEAARSPSPGVSPLMPVQIALDGRFLDFSAPYARYLGHSRAALRRKRFLDVTDPEDLEWQRRDRRRLLGGKTDSLVFEKRYRTRRGEVVWASVCVAPVHDPDGELRRVFSFVRDVTGWKRAGAARRPLLEAIEEQTELDLRCHPEFAARDARWLARLPPALEAIAERRPLPHETMLERLLESVARRPTIALDRSGRPFWISPQARELLPPQGVPETLAEAARNLAVLAPPAVRALDLHGLHAELFLCRDSVVLVELAPAEAPADLTPLAARYGLTRAERDVLGALSLGLSNAEIARRLFLSVNTVQTHLQRILRKLGVSSRLRAALLAIDRS